MILLIKERLLKDTFIREAPLSNDITEVKIDLRAFTHDVLYVKVRGMPVGSIVVDKNDSMIIARRLIPETLKQGNEPIELVYKMGDLANAYFDLLVEIGNARSWTDHILILKKHADAISDGTLPGDGHLFLSDRKVRTTSEDNESPQTSLTGSNDQGAKE